MLHLIKLELKKGGLQSYLWGSIVAYAVIAGFMMLLYFVEGSNAQEPLFRSYTEMFEAIDLFVRSTFIIYASVMISKLIISEFRDKTITLLFAYPVSRKKLIIAKLSIVFFWTFLNVIIANLFVVSLFVAVNSGVGYVPGPLTTEMLIQQGVEVLLQAIGAAGMSLLSLPFGLRKKSVATTIVSSILIVLIVCSNNMGFSLSSIIAIPLALAAIGLTITYLSFRNIDRVDIG